MTIRKRKRIWKRLRFWLSMLLLVIIAFAILCWHAHRTSKGPPPTLPGQSPEFDVLLGRGSMLLASVPFGTRPYLPEINAKWLFAQIEDEWTVDNLLPLTDVG